MADGKFEYEIRQADKNDIPMIMEYIGEDWREGHILSVDRELFEYEFLQTDGMLSMVIAFNVDKKRMDGCLGYLKTAYGTEKFDTWGSVWKVRKGSGNLLGLQLLEHVQNIHGNRYYLGVGMNPCTSVKIHEKVLKEYAGKMKHWYYLAKQSGYQLAVVKHTVARKDPAGGLYEVKLMDCHGFDVEFDKMPVEDGAVPYKNKQYYICRYFCHPIYSYQTYGIFKNQKMEAFFVLREDVWSGRTAIRMVDYCGDERCMCGISNILPDLFSRKEVEYLDFYEYGFSDECLQNAGFTLLKENDKNIIPNYFGPFVQENIDIWVTSPVKNAKFVKGDGDQDRPNKRL